MFEPAAIARDLLLLLERGEPADLQTARARVVAAMVALDSAEVFAPTVFDLYEVVLRAIGRASRGDAGAVEQARLLLGPVAHRIFEGRADCKQRAA